VISLGDRKLFELLSTKAAGKSQLLFAEAKLFINRHKAVAPSTAADRLRRSR
jgi:hypothetical protein